MTTTIRQRMTDDHRHCDDFLAATEQAIGAGNVSDAKAAFATFNAAMLTHFRVEEEILFPGFEDRTGMTQGPTRVMRMEHAQIRSLLDEAAEALGGNDVDAYLGVVETLIVMMQQHNMKEENILYPMCDQHLAGEMAEFVARLEQGLTAG